MDAPTPLLSAKRDFNRLGLSLLAMALIPLLVQLVLAFVIALLTPSGVLTERASIGTLLGLLPLYAVARHNARKAYLLRRGDADSHIAEAGKAALNEVDRINGKQRAAARLFLRPDRLDRAPDVGIDDAVEGIKLRRI